MHVEHQWYKSFYILELYLNFVLIQKYLFEKSLIPERSEEKVDFIKKLSQIGVTLRSYSTAYEKDEITRYIHMEYL